MTSLAWYKPRIHHLFNKSHMLSYMPSMKCLGLLWHPETDLLHMYGIQRPGKHQGAKYEKWIFNRIGFVYLQPIWTYCIVPSVQLWRRFVTRSYTWNVRSRHFLQTSRTIGIKMNAWYHVSYFSFRLVCNEILTLSHACHYIYGLSYSRDTSADDTCSIYIQTFS